VYASFEGGGGATGATTAATAAATVAAASEGQAPRQCLSTEEGREGEEMNNIHRRRGKKTQNRKIKRMPPCRRGEGGREGGRDVCGHTGTTTIDDIQ
jgi:hypothetical protein